MPCRATARKPWLPGSTATSPSRSTSALSRTKWLDCFLHPDRAVHGLEADLAPAAAERPLDVAPCELAVHREGIVGADGTVHRLRLHVCVELRRELGVYRAVDRGGGNPASVSERLHANPHIAVDRLGFHGALRRDYVYVAAHRVDDQRATRPGYVHIAHHRGGAEAHTARQPYREVHCHIVVARPSQLDVTLPRAAAAVADAVAAPHRADGNAALVGHGDEAHARGVRGPIGLHGGDLQGVTFCRLDCHRASGVPDPHPLVRAELGAIGPRRRGRATRAAIVTSELVPQVAESNGEVHHLFVHRAVGRVHCEADHPHSANQRRAANDLFAPGVPEYAHGPSLLRIGSILAGPTALGEVGFRAREGGGRSGGMRGKGAEAPLETFRIPRGSGTDAPRYTAPSARSRPYPGSPRLAYHRCGTRLSRDPVPRRTTRHRGHRQWGSWPPGVPARAGRLP